MYVCKHTHSWVELFGTAMSDFIDPFPLSSNRYEDICPSTHNMDVPHVKREDYQLTDISDDNYLSLMNDGGDIREDLKVPDGELGNTLRADYESGKELLVNIVFNSIINFTRSEYA